MNPTPSAIDAPRHPEFAPSVFDYRATLNVSVLLLEALSAPAEIKLSERNGELYLDLPTNSAG